MKGNVIIIHGCPGDEERALNPETRTYDKHWIPWLRKNLEEKGFSANIPLMPNPWKPDYLEWKKEFDKLEINEATILIGHSCGCAFLVRWLGETRNKIKKLILVAPWKVPDEEKHGKYFEIKKKFYEYVINKNIKDNVNDIIYFTSNDEEDDGKKSLAIFYESLGGKIINLKNKGHFTKGNMGTKEFPELLEEILK